MKSFYKMSLVLILTLLLTPGWSQKMVLGKSVKTSQPRIHPYTQLLAGQKQASQVNAAKTRNNRLLVIMVDFQEETTDDPHTTGNGKFALVADPAYKTTIASPPHNQEYYAANLEALRYYYLAVSRGNFDLQYDIYPQDKIAYSLPNQMSYYSPGGAGGELFLERIEEYFKQSFETADVDDPEIDFATYSHFMIIHAGSDWQHDVLGDTPSDLPSFFINIADGREAVVDGGAVRISHACNVPSTISQDYDSYEENGDTYYTGYGALNGVLAHEFGHSIGFVDLYNTYNFRPMVGQFDIMDSGGSGISVVGAGNDNEFALVEGVQPCLPGAFSTLLAFGDSFANSGLLKEINQIDLYSDLSIIASSKFQPTGSALPTIYKIPLNNSEYILVENRSIDPDEDGGTAVRSALNQRVILYPTAIEDPTNAPTYEYDYLLPSFVSAAGVVAGGGILVWHIDDSVIYGASPTQNGTAGITVTNFANNTVNGRYSQRGVKIIEADALEDIGNDYSWYWTGTPFEYFHKYRPTLDMNGSFVSWTTQPWRPELSADSTPPLRDNAANNPSLYGLNNIGQPQGVMSFQVTAGSFDDIITLGAADSGQIALPVMKTSLADLTLPVINGDILKFYAYDEISGFIEFTQLTLPYPDMTQPPMLVTLGDDEYPTLILTLSRTILFVKIANDIPDTTSLTMASVAVCSPIVSGDKLYVFSQDRCYATTDPYLGFPENYGIPEVGAVNAANGLIYMYKNNLCKFSTDDAPNPHFIIADDDFDHNSYESVYGNQTYFLTSDWGNIYAFDNRTLVSTQIFRNELSPTRPTQLALCSLLGASPAVVFGLGDRVYALDRFGTLLPGFPHYYENKSFAWGRHPKVIWVDNSEIILLPMDGGGYLAINQDGSINNGFSLPGQINSSYVIATDNLNLDVNTHKLFWTYTDNNQYLKVALVSGMSDSTIVWNGYRNGSVGGWTGAYQEPPIVQPGFTAYIYPNPVTTDLLRIRVKDFSNAIQINLFDISGKKVRSATYPASGVTERDFLIDISHLSPAVYLAVVQDDHHTTKLKFALQK